MKKLILILTMVLTSLVNAFTYQGELSQTGALFTGTADIKFTLFDSVNGGVQFTVAYTYTDISIENGRFAVDLDDWIGEFDGTPLWLEIAVDLNATGSFVTLNPRQKLDPVPYAEYAYDGAGGNGDISGVIAGTGLTGGGSNGEVTININPSEFQRRINATCPAGQAIRSINENSVIICEVDDNSGGDVTAVTAGIGLTGGGVSGDLTLNVDDSVFQRRVNTFCPIGKYMYKIEESGTALCRDDITVDGSTFWHLGGNAGIDPANDFIGTTDNNAFSIRVNNQPVSTIIPKAGTVNIISGAAVNSMDISVKGGVLAGGGEDTFNCGDTNNLSCKNEINGYFATISGGRGNIANSLNATIAGGDSNVADGVHSVVTGGLRNRAGGSLSWAGGASAIVRNSSQSGTPFGDSGTFIWNGSASVLESLTSSGQKQFLVRAPGGVWLGTGSGDITPDLLSTTLFIESTGTKDIFRARDDGVTKVIIKNDGKMGIGTTSPNSIFHVDSPSGETPFRIQIAGTTKLKVESNGGVAIGSNYDPVPSNGLKVKGNVEIVGSLSKGGGSFKIDHPLDPKNKYLYHSFVESPDMMNVYNGNTITDKNGESWVELPDYFEKLNKDFRYQLTVVGVFAQAIISKKVSNNRFLIRTNQAHVEVSWQVTGIRHDPWAEKNRIPTSVDKTKNEKGHYLHPKAYEVDEKLAIGYKQE